jgi:hypothetical protein
MTHVAPRRRRVLDAVMAEMATYLLLYRLDAAVPVPA